MSRWPAFVLFSAVAVWSELPAQIQDEFNNYKKPVAKLAQLEFSDGGTLGAVSGTWINSGGTFNSTSTTTRAIATIDSYLPESESFPQPTEIFAGKFWYRARMTRRGPNATVKVNDRIVFENVPAAQLDRTNNEFGSTFGGRVGVISHWAPGRFDNLRIEGLPVR